LFLKHWPPALGNVSHSSQKLSALVSEWTDPSPHARRIHSGDESGAKENARADAGA